MGIRRRLNAILWHLDELKRKVNIIMASQAELTTALNAVNDKLVKVGTETTALLARINELQALLANAPVNAELQAAFDRVQAQAGVVDDLVVDVPPSP